MKVCTSTTFALALCAVAAHSYASELTSQQHIDQLLQGSSDAIRKAAQSMHQARVQDRQTLDIAAQLLAQNAPSARDNDSADALAWVCKALAQSRDGRYKSIVAQVGDSAPNRKLKKHCAKAARSLPLSAESFFPGSIDLNQYRYGAAPVPAPAQAYTAPPQPAGYYAQAPAQVPVAVPATHAYVAAPVMAPAYPVQPVAMPMHAPVAAVSPFSRIQPGMSLEEVTALVGKAADISTRPTMQALNPLNITHRNATHKIHSFPGYGTVTFSQPNTFTGTWRVVEVTGQ